MGDDGYMDAAAVPVPDAGDDTLRVELARRLSRTATERGYRLLDERYPLVDALLPLIHEHVAKAELRADARARVSEIKERLRAEKAEAAIKRVREDVRLHLAVSDDGARTLAQRLWNVLGEQRTELPVVGVGSFSDQAEAENWLAEQRGRETP